MSDTPQKTNPHNIVATVEETQKMTLNTSKTKHFANTICVLVTGITMENRNDILSSSTTSIRKNRFLMKKGI